MLKKLKAALDAAKKALDAKPEDEALKAALEKAQKEFDEALAASEDDEEEDESDEQEESKDKGDKLDTLTPEQLKKLVKDLRKENGDKRGKVKTLTEGHNKLKQALVDAGIIENDEESPEEKLKVSSMQSEAMTMRAAILESAIEHGVGKEGLDYFTFLVEKKAASLGEDEELTADDLAEIAKEVSSKSGKGGGTTGAGGGNGGGSPPPGGKGGTTLEQFTKMSIAEKSKLYSENRDLYNKLIAEAKDKKVLV